jgi:murein L,D-transpeptidase YcbB/YkuD
VREDLRRQSAIYLEELRQIGQHVAQQPRYLVGTQRLAQHTNLLAFLRPIYCVLATVRIEDRRIAEEDRKNLPLFCRLGIAQNRSIYWTRFMQCRALHKYPKRQHLASLVLLPLVVVLLHGRVSAATEADFDPISSAIRDIVLGRSESLSETNSLVRFYTVEHFAAAWFDGTSVLDQAEQVLAIISEAPSHGLTPADYDAAQLSERLHAIAGERSLSPQEVAQIDVALTTALFRYLTHLHSGRVRPRDVQATLHLASKELDLAKLVRDAINAGALRDLAKSLAPQYPMYERLRATLDHYRVLAEDDSLRALPIVRKLEPGAPYLGLTALRHWLEVLGDLPASAPQYVNYTGELVDAVKRFQARHGLEPDGVVGRATFEQLNIPLARRVRQIELALERMRWIPLFESERVIVVNIPEFRLRAFDLQGASARMRLDMKVIVGRALSTQTPVFMEDMQYVEFSPYWNVPPSIARDELVAKLRKDPGYLDREGMEFISSGRDTRVSSRVSARNLSALASGDVRLRQRPGAYNALGGIKFVLPNNMDIYLHDTPTPQLFARSRRDFSHGCIRVEQPVELAKFVLENQPQWTEERIRQAMRAGKPSVAHLTQAVPVVIFYTTALVESDGRVLFLRDVYGHDEALDRALKARQSVDRAAIHLAKQHAYQ